MEEEGFWGNKEEAEKTITAAQKLKTWIKPCQIIEQRVENVDSIVKEAVQLGDDGLVQDIVKECKEISTSIEEVEVQSMLSGPMDFNSCYLKINAGAGGTESCDWVEMLARMYERWGQRRGFKLEVLEALQGDVAGLKSILYKINGQYAYGYLKGEKGVHRLVRISPFDSAGKRHTSFASVEVTPEVSAAIEIEIKPDDIRVDTYRAQGAGGQHINVTDSAVRITHLPSKIVISCQSERSQRQNKETCLELLKAKLYEKELEERESKLQAIVGEKKKIEWGSQIRSYVLHPYSLVTDLRTKNKVTNAQAVLDGDLDTILMDFLRHQGLYS
jgi:peptide chain release factor 2